MLGGATAKQNRHAVLQLVPGHEEAILRRALQNGHKFSDLERSAAR
jgi:hypothetical protein